MAADADRLESCPRLALAFALLGKRWTALILDVLLQRPARFSEIHQAIPNLSERLLSERLHELMVAGVVERSGSDGAPVVYALTDAGRPLAPALDAIRSWAGALDGSAAAPPATSP